MGRPASMFFWKGRGYATDAGGRRQLLVKGPKTKANRDLATQRLAALLGRPIPNDVLADPHVTVSALVEEFLKHCKARLAAGEIKPATLHHYYSPYGAVLQQACGHWRANAIDEAMVLGLRQQLRERGLSHNTIKNYLGVLSAVLKWAHKRGYIAEATHAAIPCLPRRRREHIPTADELDRLIDAAAQPVRDVLVTILNAPVRPGDCYHLRRREVDLDNQLIRLSDSKTGPRLVCIVPRVQEILRRRLKDCTQPDDLVFTTSRGKPWRMRWFAECVQEARTKAGLGDHVTAYTLRHAWTTRAFLNGVPLPTVQALRGDRDLKTTAWYLHLADHLSHLQEAARQAVGLSPEAG